MNFTYRKSLNIKRPLGGNSCECVFFKHFDGKKNSSRDFDHNSIFFSNFLCISILVGIKIDDKKQVFRGAIVVVEDGCKDEPGRTDKVVYRDPFAPKKSL